MRSGRTISIPTNRRGTGNTGNNSALPLAQRHPPPNRPDKRATSLRWHDPDQVLTRVGDVYNAVPDIQIHAWIAKRPPLSPRTPLAAFYYTLCILKRCNVCIYRYDPSIIAHHTRFGKSLSPIHPFTSRLCMIFRKGTVF